MLTQEQSSLNKKIWTYDDYLELVKEDDTKRYEIIGGELIELMPPNIKHQRVLDEILLAFKKINDRLDKAGL